MVRGRDVLGALWAVLLATAGVLGVLAYRAEADPELRPWPVLLLWLASLACFLAAAGTLQASRGWRPRVPRLPRGEALALLGLTLAALFVRVVALDRVPDTVGGDEGELGRYARAVLDGELRDPFTTGWAGHPTVWSFVHAASLAVFGDDVVGLRMIAALLGTAAVPLVYVFARAWYGREVAVVAATLLTAYQFHLHYSRIGVNSVGDALWLLLALTLLLTGLRRASPLYLAAAGVAAGVAQHFYLGSRLVPLVLACVLAHQALFARAALRGAVRHLPLVLVGFVLGYGPGIRIPIHHWDDYNARLSQVGVFQSGWFDERRALGDSVLDIVRYQIVQSFGAFTHVSDRAVNYLPGMPLLDAASAAFFLVGLVVVTLEWRRAVSAGIAAWIVGTVLTGGVLLVDPPQSHRYAIVAPALCVVVALGIVRTASAISRPAPRLRTAAFAVTALVVAGIATWNLHFYFREYSSRHVYAGFHAGEELTALGRYLDGEGKGAYVYFLGAPVRFLDNGTVRFLAPATRGHDVLEQLVDAESVPRNPRGRVVFVLLPHRFPELTLIRSVYPAGQSRSFVSTVDGAPLFVTYEPRLERGPRAIAPQGAKPERGHAPGRLGDDRT